MNAEDVAWLNTHHVGMSCVVMDPAPDAALESLMLAKEETEWMSN